MRNYADIVLGAILGLSIAGTAHAAPEFIWSDEKGLVEADKCQDGLSDEISLKTSHYYSNGADNKPYEVLRSKTGKAQYYLPNASLIKLISADNDRFQIEVIGSSKSNDYKHNQYTAQRGHGSAKASDVKKRQNLFIYNQSVENLDQYVFELNSAKEKSLEGSYLQVAMEAQKYNISECCIGNSCSEYLVFDVFSKGEEEAVTRIGVSGNETSLFKDMTGWKVSELDEKLKKEIQEKKEKSKNTQNKNIQQVADVSKSQLNSEENEEAFDEESDNSQKIMTSLPFVVEGEFENVVCLDQRNASLNVRDESQKKVLFKLNNGDKIKVFQSFDAKEKTLGDEDYNFVKIQSVDSGKTGWVAKRFVSQKAKCASKESEEPAKDNSENNSSSGKVFEEKQYTVCTASGGALSVYDTNFEKLSQNYFLDSGEKATVIDGTLKDMPTPNGYKYVKVKTESGYTRYVAKDFLTTKKCETAETSGGGQSSNGYIFPTITSTGYSYIPRSSRPYQSSKFSGFAGYRGNWGVYGAGRSGGRRAHAATDLYQPRGLKRPSKAYSHNHFGGAFRAMRGGKVVRGSTHFYLGTNYIVIHHDDGVVSRYGEIYPGTVYKSKTVKTGQTLGYIKWVGVGSVPPMLHFENYYPKNASVRSGSLSGSKRINGKNSQRSSHLFNRTDFMKKLERNTFK